MTEKKLMVAMTGATGFVGGELARSVLSRGHGLRLLARTPEAARELREAGAEVQQGDVSDPASVQGLAEGADIFFHVAAMFRETGPDKLYWDVNYEGTKNCLEEARRAGVKRFVHCSTIGVLSHIDNPPADETFPYNPGDIYQETKAAGEKLALKYFREGLIPGAVIRPAMIYGPGDLRLLKVFRPVARRRWVTLGSGRTIFHFIYIDDLVDAFWLAAEKPDVNGEVFIIGGPDQVTLNELVGMIADSAGVPRPRLKLPAKPFQWLGSFCEAVMLPLGLKPPIYRRRVDFFTKDRSFSINKARTRLGFEPRVSTREGVEKTLQWYVSQGHI